MSKVATPIKSGGDADDKSKRVAQLKLILQGMTDFTRETFENDETKQGCIDRLNARVAEFKSFGSNLDKRFNISKDIIDEVVYLHELIKDGGGYNAIESFDGKIMELQNALIATTAKTV